MDSRTELLREMAKEFNTLNPTESLERMADIATTQISAWVEERSGSALANWIRREFGS